ncbi:MAG TPA: alkaline phosphatase family protein, partial [Flavisolibacter sp.]
IGHATTYTGSVPALHGIMGNSWYDKYQKRNVYCVEDKTVHAVGSQSSAGQMSPRNLWANSITDELRLATNFRSKTISVAIKDRGSVLPGGHTSNGSYWFDNAIGGMITSSFYMNELPQWVQQFNNKKLPDAYLKKAWNTLYPIKTYIQSTADSNIYETRMPGEDISFPHRLDTIRVNKYEAFKTSPFGNSYTFDMARAAIEGEKLGARGITDFLAVSFSSTDYIGHTFSPNSIETEDTYLRFDADLAAFITYLDQQVGKNNYLLFLTADHGVAHNPYFLRDHKIPGGVFDHNAIRRQLTDTLYKRYGVNGIVAQTINYQLFLNDSIIQKSKLDRNEIKKFLVSYFIVHPSVSHVVDLADIDGTPLPGKLRMMFSNGYNQKLSGDLQFIIKPQWYERWQTGASHVLWNPYDSKIPLLWYGWKIKPGRTGREIYMTDIAATLADLLKIQVPNACIGEVITEITD